MNRGSRQGTLGIGLLMAAILGLGSSNCSDGASDNGNSLAQGGTQSNRDSGAGGESSGGLAGEGGGAGSVACDTSANPREETCLIDDEYAVFVSITGDDDGDGTQENPVATLAKAVEVAAGQKNILVCNARYDEQAVIADGARVFGGFDCTTWEPKSGAPLYRPTTPDPALLVDGALAAVLIDGVDFEAIDAVDPGASAIAAVVNESDDVTLRRVVLMAGAGQHGADPTIDDYVYPEYEALEGNDGDAIDGGSGGYCMCADGSTSKRGGGGVTVLGPGGLGLPDYPGPGGEGGLGGTSCDKDTYGKTGATGPAGDDGFGARSHGVLAEGQWVPTAGGDATDGKPGQGGGGGGAAANGGGGSGGCGGCPGKAGVGGGGGGASVGLVSIDSIVSLEASQIQTASGGSGGSGAAGQAGEEFGGNGGHGFASACHGGEGGPGGDGGDGGGGAGGLSVGIMFAGAVPMVSLDTTMDIGIAGLGGEGGNERNAGILARRTTSST